MIKNKKILIIGLGKEGVSAAIYLQDLNEVAIYDDKKKSEIEKSYLSKIGQKVKLYFTKIPEKEKFDLVVRSPGVKPDHAQIKKLVKLGAELTSPTRIFFEDCPVPIIGVTGTKGKGTTSTLIYEMLKTQLPSVFLAGNIGIPALDILSQLTTNSLVVLELSSFQLIDLNISPHVAVVLMITQEHLDWHLDLNEYTNAKKSIVKFQNARDIAVINQDFPATRQFAKETKGEVFFVSLKSKTNGTYLKNDQIESEIVSKETICNTADVLLPGFHNLQNVLAAVAVAKLEGITAENIKKVLTTFKGLPHRLELVRELRGVRYYNDSYSTTPETAIAAIEAFPDNNKILILGGSSKKSDFSDLARKIVKEESVIGLILIGDEAPRILSAINKAGKFKGEIYQNLKTMKEIVSTARKVAKKGDVVILSPACASFDMFPNYQVRGDQFRLQVTKLSSK